jgi:predicted nicotinamide N-methyase
MSENQPPPFVRTPEEAIQETTRDIVFIDEERFLLYRPADYDRILNDPVVREANELDEYMPYWATIWPGARMLAKAVLREPWQTHFPQGLEGKQALEIGCGLGLAGLVALRCGFEVCFSDYDLAAIEFASRNAKRNGFTRFTTKGIDWRNPPLDRKYDVILGSDISYEVRNIDPVLNLIQNLLEEDGIALITDPDRISAPKLREALNQSGLNWTMSLIRAGEPGGERHKGTLYRIRHAQGDGEHDK